MIEMSTTYRLKASTLDESFLEDLKATYGDQEIEITVSEFNETDYLLKSEVNKQRLLQAIENVKQRKKLVEIPLDNLE